MNNRRAMLLLIVLCGMIISICIGLRQTLGLYMRPMTLDAGVSAAAFGFSIALQNIVWGISQPFVGAIADRWGARPVVIVEFDNVHKAMTAHDSPAYQEALKVLGDGAERDFRIVEGVS